jgi:hypothetical protein
MVVLGGGFAASACPLNVPPTIVLEPDALEGPTEHELLIAVAVSAAGVPGRALTLATLAELDEPPLGPVEPWVLTFSSPALRTLHVGDGAQALAAVWVKGPPPVAGRVTVGSGPEVTLIAPKGVTFTLSPNAPPDTLVTSAWAGAASIKIDAPAKKLTDANRAAARRVRSGSPGRLMLTSRSVG